MKTAKQLGITPTQRRNIARLTLFVKDAVPPPRFDINTHHSGDNDNPSAATYECGTTACFCGYGPLAGIKPKRSENWFSYATRAMTGGYVSMLGSDSKLWTFLFDGEHKNSKSAAVRRGAYFLMNGLPEGESLDTWEAPRSFRPDWEAIKEIAQ